MVALNAPVCVPDGTPMLTDGLSTSTLTVFDVAAVVICSIGFAATPIVTVCRWHRCRRCYRCYCLPHYHSEIRSPNPCHAATSCRSYCRCVDGVTAVCTPTRDASVHYRSEMTSDWTKPDTVSVNVIVASNARIHTVLFDVAAPVIIPWHQ